MDNHWRSKAIQQDLIGTSGVLPELLPEVKFFTTFDLQSHQLRDGPQENEYNQADWDLGVCGGIRK